MRKIDDDVKRKAIKQIHNGQSVVNLSRELGVSVSLLREWAKQNPDITAGVDQSDSTTDKKDHIVQLLMKEYDGVSQGIRNLLVSGEKAMGLTISIIAAGLTFKDKLGQILVFLLLGVLVIMIYVVRLFTELMATGGYKRYLEERLNQVVGERILLWESVIAKKRHSAFDQYPLPATFLVLLGITAWFSLKTAYEYYNRPLFMGIVSLVAGLVFLLVILFIRMRRAFDLIYNIAKNTQTQEPSIFEKNVEITASRLKKVIPPGHTRERLKLELK